MTTDTTDHIAALDAVIRSYDRTAPTCIVAIALRAHLAEHAKERAALQGEQPAAVPSDADMAVAAARSWRSRADRLVDERDALKAERDALRAEVAASEAARPADRKVERFLRAAFADACKDFDAAPQDRFANGWRNALGHVIAALYNHGSAAPPDEPVAVQRAATGAPEALTVERLAAEIATSFEALEGVDDDQRAAFIMARLGPATLPGVEPVAWEKVPHDHPDVADEERIVRGDVTFRVRFGYTDGPPAHSEVVYRGSLIRHSWWPSIAAAKDGAIRWAREIGSAAGMVGPTSLRDAEVRAMRAGAAAVLRIWNPRTAETRAANEALDAAIAGIGGEAKGSPVKCDPDICAPDCPRSIPPAHPEPNAQVSDEDLAAAFYDAAQASRSRGWWPSADRPNNWADANADVRAQALAGIRAVRARLGQPAAPQPTGTRTEWRERNGGARSPFFTRQVGPLGLRVEDTRDGDYVFSATLPAPRSDRHAAPEAARSAADRWAADALAAMQRDEGIAAPQPVAMTVKSALQARGVVEFYDDLWKQWRQLGDAGEGRGWSGGKWSRVYEGGAEITHGHKPARLVPFADADRDPNERGPIASQPPAKSLDLGACCHEPGVGDGEACPWFGRMSELRRDERGITHCPSCGSTAIEEDIDEERTRTEIAKRTTKPLAVGDRVRVTLGGVVKEIDGRWITVESASMRGGEGSFVAASVTGVGEVRP